MKQPEVGDFVRYYANFYHYDLLTKEEEVWGIITEVYKGTFRGDIIYSTCNCGQDDDVTKFKTPIEDIEGHCEIIAPNDAPDKAWEYLAKFRLIGAQQ